MVAPRRFALIGHIHEASSIVGFDEAAQDAVGSILVDSATIDFTYSDATPSITAATIPAGILAQLLTVDGAGSLLDADFLDGLSSASFALAATTVTAGAGLTGSGTLGANLTLAVGAGNGILANADDVALDLNYAPTWTNTHIWTDNDSIYLGTGSDLRLYHDGTDSFITNATGILNLGTTASYTQTVTSNDLVLKIGSTHANGSYVSFNRSGTDFGYIGNAKHLVGASANTGFGIRAETALEISLAGTLAATLKDASGVTHPIIKVATGATNGITLLGDTASATESIVNFGAMYSSGGASIGYAVKPKSGGAADAWVSSYGSSIARSAIMVKNGSIVLQTASATTTAAGSDVTMNTRWTIQEAGHLVAGDDSIYVRVGASADASFYHDGTDTYLVNATGKLRIENAAASGVVQFNANNKLKAKVGLGGECFAITADDSSGEVYFAFYESNAFTTRKGYMGFGNSNDDQFIIMSEENATLTLGQNSVARMNLTAASCSIVSTDQAFMGNGTVSAPAWSFASDPDCGAYKESTANNWSLAAGGVSYLQMLHNTTTVKLRANNADMIVCNATGIGFNNQTPIARPDYTVTNKSLNRAVDCNGVLAAIGDNLGSLVDDLISYGLLQ